MFSKNEMALNFVDSFKVKHKNLITATIEDFTNFIETNSIDLSKDRKSVV